MDLQVYTPTISEMQESGDLVAQLIFRELRCFRKDMRREVKKLGKRLECILSLNETNLQDEAEETPVETVTSLDPIVLDNIKMIQDNGFSIAGSNGLVKCKQEVSEDVIDITDCFDDLEVPQSNVEQKQPVDEKPLLSKLLGTVCKEEAATSSATSPDQSSFNKNAASSKFQAGDQEVNNTERFSIASKSVKADPSLTKPCTSTPVKREESIENYDDASTDEEGTIVGDKKSYSVAEQGESSDMSSGDETPSNRDDRRVLNEGLNSTQLNNLLSEESMKSMPVKKSQPVSTSLMAAKNCQINIITDSKGDTLYECPFCHKRSRHHCNIKRHLPTHTGEKRFSCMFCSKAFARSSHMRNHLLTHTGERPYKCDLCPKAYSSSGSLHAHKILHEKDEQRQKQFTPKDGTADLPGTRERPWTCKVCEKMFRQRGHLAGHMRTHTGEKNFHCLVCSKPFPRKEHLIRHMRSHTGEKPYKCMECPSAFSDKSSLRKHRITVHRLKTV